MAKQQAGGPRVSERLDGPADEVDAGVLRDGHNTPLPWSSNTFAAAW